MFGTTQARGGFLANIPAPARTAVLGVLIAALSPAAFGEFGAVFGPETFVQDSSKAVDFTRNVTLQDPAPTYILRIDNTGTPGTPPVSDGSITLNGVEIVGSKDFTGDSKEPVILIQKVIHPVGNNELVVHLDSHQPGALTIQITGVHTFRVFGPEDFVRQTGTAVEVPRTFTVPNPNTIWFVRITNGGLRGQFPEVSSAVITLNGTDVAQQDDFSKGQGCQTSECAPVIEKFVGMLSMNDLQVELTSDPGSGLTVEVLGIDNDAPVISDSAAPPPNPNGWNNSDVTVTFTCSDILSGIAFCTPPVQVTAEGANQVIAGIARDNAGNVASASVTVSIDKTPPVISAAVAPPPNSAGWNNSNVTVTFTCSDSLSGIDFCPGPIVVSAEGANQAASGTARDRAGNTATTSRVINLEKTPPTLTITSPLSGAVVPLSPLTVTGNVSDGLSGIASVSCQGSSAVLSGSTFTCIVPILAGPNSISVQATDVAGNVRQASITIQGGVPTILSTTPNTGQQGQTNLSIAIVGQFTNFVQGTSQVSFGAGITVGAVTVANTTSLTAQVSIAANAVVGARTITVTTGNEVASLLNGFTVAAAVNQRPIVTVGPDQTISLQPAPVVFTEYPVPTPPTTAGGGPESIARGPDGNLWFTESSENKVGRITSGGVFTEFPVPTSGYLQDIAAGPDGNLWFTDYSGSRIWRITTAGVLTPFPLAGGSFPFGITAGPDGNLWFTERIANNIGRITPAGVITEFPVPTGNSQPEEITTGPDGNLWFSENGGANGVIVAPSKIGRITASGVITEFPVPTTNGGPYGVTTGPDGNLWFTEASGNKIGRITTSGVFAEFPIPTANSGATGITAGPDGNLWFTEQNAAVIARLTPAGVFTEFPLPSGSSRPYGITLGPDCNLWFTEIFANNIGRIVPGVLPVTTNLNGSITDDGLPFGAMLTTTWSATSGPAPVSFGTPTATFPDIAGVPNPVTTLATFCRVGPYTLSLEGSDSQLTSSSNVTITVNPPPTVPTIVSVSPNGGQQGQQDLSVVITGQLTHFVQGTTTASFGAGITVGTVTAASVTSLMAQISIAGNATLGPRTVTVTTGTEVATLPGGFTVVAGNQPPVVSAGPNQTISLGSAQVAFTEYSVPTVGSAPAVITAGSDGNLWFTEFKGNNIGRITPTGLVSEFALPTAGSFPDDITAGPDGNLWFTEYYAANKIGKITTSGVITEYSIPSAVDLWVSSITTGPDGNLWFAEQHGNKIGRITTSGVITEFPISNSPERITTGPDGNLWFTEYYANQVARITLAGVVTEFPVAGGHPYAITKGPDGKLWFTEYVGGNNIGTVDISGVITEFPISTIGANPTGITAGPDGNLWFAEEAGNNIGRITTVGAITEYPLPTAGSAPQFITTGPDGNLWFTEYLGNKIGKVNFGVFSSPATTTLTGSVTDDGLPVGATLATTWSESSGPIPVLFGTSTATFPDVAGQANPVVTLATFSVPGTYTLTLTGSDLS